MKLSRWLDSISQHPTTRQRPNKRRRGTVASKTRSFHRVALEPLEERRLLAATVYVDDDWAGTTLGADPDGDGPATSFGPGGDAFAAIQEGVNAVDALGTVHVAPGVYTELVSVNKTISLLGAQAGVDARSRGMVDESIVNGPGGSFALAANGIVLDGFTVSGTTGLPLGTGIHTSAAFSGYQLRNNIIENNVIGLYLNSSGATQTVVEQNLIRDNDNPGAAGGTGVYSDQGLANALLLNNRIAGQNPTAGINLVSAAATDVNIYANEFADGNQLVLFNVNDSIVSGNSFTGVLPTGTGSAIFVGGGSDGLHITFNSFIDFGNRALSVTDAGFGPNANLQFSGNTIAADVNLLPSGRALIDLNGLQGFYSVVSDNTITLKGATNASVSFINAIDIRGASTQYVAINSNTFDGGHVDNFDGFTDSVAVRLHGTLSSTASIGITGNVITGFVNGVVADALPAGAIASLFLNSIAGNSNAGLVNGAGATIDATRNWWGDINGPTNAANPGGVGQSASGPVTFQPWLVYAPDGNAALPGVQLVASFTVPAQIDGFTATNNNYRRLANAFDSLLADQTMVLDGHFDWTEINAAAAWAQGNDTLPGTSDDYSIAVPQNINDVTITAAALGSATIQGPGDVATANLEGFLAFNGGDNQNWTISNLRIFEFDLAIGMFNGSGGSDAYANTQIIGNHIIVATDLNTTIAPADVNQNIGIHFSFGNNQTIAGNLIDFAGTGVSDSANSRFATSVGMQSNTSGGTTYDGLLIDNNTLRVLGAQSADPEVFLGIWENAHGHQANITVSDNAFLNLAAGNDPALNQQRAFRVTSHSSATSTVTYSGNTVDGANIAFQWLAGQNFAGRQPVQLWANTLTNNATGVLVQSNGVANLYRNDITGSGDGAGVHVVTGSLLPSGPVPTAVQENFIRNGSGDGILIEAAAGPIGEIFDNDLSGNAGFAINNLSAASILAEFNWFGSELPLPVAAAVKGPVDYDPWLDNGEDLEPLTPGFQGDLLNQNSNDRVDLVLVKDNGVTTVTPGETVVYVLNYSNTGNLDAAGVVLTESLPAGTTFNAAASTAGWIEASPGVYTLAIGTVISGGGGSAVFAVNVNNTAVAGQTEIVNVASIADDGASGEDRVPGDNSATEIDALSAAPDLVLTKTDGMVTFFSNPLHYVLTYHNVGNQDATGVVLTETVPAGTAFNAADSTPGWTQTAPGSGVYQLVVGSLASGASGTATFSVFVLSIQAGREQIVNTATISDDGSNGPDPTPLNNMAVDVTVLDVAPNLTLSKTDNRTTVVPGGILTYVLASTNRGSQEASGVFLTEYLPAGTTFNPAASTPGWIETEPGVFKFFLDPPRVHFVTLPPIRVYDTVMFSVTVNDPAAFGQTEIVNVATISDDGTSGPDSNPDDNTAIDTTSLVGPGLYAVGADAGGGPHVRVYDAKGQERYSFFAYSSNFTGGVRVAMGDVTGDGTPDIITAAGPGGGPHIRVFDGLSGQQVDGAIGSFFAYDIGFTGGVFIATADFDGDGRADIVTGAGQGGGAHVRVFSGADGSLLRDFFDHAKVDGGVRVAAGDINGDGTPDIIAAPGPGNFPAMVHTYDGATGQIFAGAAGSIFAYPGFGGGMYVASGDVNGDGRDDIITGAGAGGGPHVKVFSGLDGSELASFFAYNAGFRGGVRVGTVDIGLDGQVDILTGAGPSGGPHVKAFSVNGGEIQSFFAFNIGFTGGVFVAGSGNGDFVGAAILASGAPSIPGGAPPSPIVEPLSAIPTAGSDIEIPTKPSVSNFALSADLLFGSGPFNDDWSLAAALSGDGKNDSASLAAVDLFWEDADASLTI